MDDRFCKIGITISRNLLSKLRDMLNSTYDRDSTQVFIYTHDIYSNLPWTFTELNPVIEKIVKSYE